MEEAGHEQAFQNSRSALAALFALSSIVVRAADETIESADESSRTTGDAGRRHGPCR